TEWPVGSVYFFSVQPVRTPPRLLNTACTSFVSTTTSCSVVSLTVAAAAGTAGAEVPPCEDSVAAADDAAGATSPSDGVDADCDAGTAAGFFGGGTSSV